MIVPAALALLIAADTVPGAYQAEINRALFEHCPRLIEGTLSLSDPAQLEGIGYVPGTVRNGNRFYQRVVGDQFVELHYGTNPHGRVCWVSYGGPEVQSLFDGATAAAREQGYEGEPAAQLGGPSRMIALRRRDGGSLTFNQMIVITDSREVVGFAFVSTPERE